MPGVDPKNSETRFAIINIFQRMFGVPSRLNDCEFAFVSNRKPSERRRNSPVFVPAMWLTPNIADVSTANEGWPRSPFVDEDDEEDEA